jgi:hypothetical protein
MPLKKCVKHFEVIFYLLWYPSTINKILQYWIWLFYYLNNNKWRQFLTSLLSINKNRKIKVGPINWIVTSFNFVLINSISKTVSQSTNRNEVLLQFLVFSVKKTPGWSNVGLINEQKRRQRYNKESKKKQKRK